MLKLTRTYVCRHLSSLQTFILPRSLLVKLLWILYGQQAARKRCLSSSGSSARPSSSTAASASAHACRQQLVGSCHVNRQALRACSNTQRCGALEQQQVHCGKVQVTKNDFLWMLL